MSLEHLEALMIEHGNACYEGDRREPVTVMEHALQCATLAGRHGATRELIAAAFLHDIGHLLISSGVPDDNHRDNTHEVRGADFLEPLFGAAVAEPVRLHVAAKRFLCFADPGYLDGLSPASRHSLALQGGVMTFAEAMDFRTQPYATDAILLRQWDDLSKFPGARTAAPAEYFGLLRGLRQPLPAL